MDKPEFHVEESTDGAEIEVYVNGLFLASVNKEDVNPEVLEIVQDSMDHSL